MSQHPCKMETELSLPVEVLLYYSFGSHVLGVRLSITIEGKPVSGAYSFVEIVR